MKPTQPRRLIVNADDFGFTEGVNAGVVEAFRSGVLTSTSLMANGDAFADAARLARENQRLDVGCHLTLLGGFSVADPERPLPRSMFELLARLTRGLSGREIEREFSAQVEKTIAAGIRPSHLDTHKHTHLWPSVLNAVLRVARRFEIPWVRRPFDVPITAASNRVPWPRRATSRLLRPLRSRFERRLAQAGCRAADHFAGFQLTGHLRGQELASLIRELPAGLTEFMCHPGKLDAKLLHASTRLKQSREAELAALCSEEVRGAVAAAGVELVGFRDAPAQTE